MAEAVTIARARGATGEIVVRADSAFYSKKFVTACRRARVRFSVTARMDAKVQAACAAISRVRVGRHPLPAGNLG